MGQLLYLNYCLAYADIIPKKQATHRYALIADPTFTINDL